MATEDEGGGWRKEEPMRPLMVAKSDHIKFPRVLGWFVARPASALSTFPLPLSPPFVPGKLGTNLMGSTPLLHLVYWVPTNSLLPSPSSLL